jgi:hypothetical protein
MLEQVGPSGQDSGLGGGISNDAPIGTIPVTADGDGNLVASSLTDDGESNPTIGLNTAPNGSVTFRVVGAGGQLSIRAADGDAERVGGEVDIRSGDSEGSNGGDIQITSGKDRQGGDSGGITVQTGDTLGIENQGDVGDLTVRGGDSTDGDAGRVLVQGGNSGTGGGGLVRLQAGNSTSGTQGIVQIYDANFTQGLEVSSVSVTIADKLAVSGNVGFYGTTPVARPQVPAIVTAQNIVDALITLGLITQAA